MTVALSTIRHSASHILAQAILRMFPDAKLGIGPSIEDGFYYDFDLPRSLTPQDLESLEVMMREIVKENQSFSTFNLPKADAVAMLAPKNQTYKLELIEGLNLPEYSFYENGPFVDLCKGPHVNSTAQVGAIKLLKIAGAYWKGSEKNPMLQRIYGTAFHTQEELDAYLKQVEEAAKRDHRLLGKELDLFSIRDEIGGGLVLWHPKGARLRHIMEEYWRKKHFKSGYELVNTPHVGKSNLWATSGHLGFYQENMYAPMSIDDQDYFIKPMNCPFHIMIYKNKQHSYRELPLRWAELGTVYRYERSGVLHGLMRVRGFTQDDAHIMCTQDQVRDEIAHAFRLCLDILKQFGFTTFKIFISTKPEEKFVGEPEHWTEAEASLKAAVEEFGLEYDIDEGGGAFYGPKIDIKIQDAIGREWQCSTIQFDFNLPERFDMTYIGPDGNKHRPFMIHRALLGSLERFFGILIEHYEGKFPVWLSPVQVKILNINHDTEAYAQSIMDTLQEKDIRIETDFSSEKIGYKIRQAIMEKVPYIIVLGNKEKESNTISVRSRGEATSSTGSLDDFINKVLSESSPSA